MRQKFTVLLLIVSFVQISFAQTSATKTEAEIAAETNKQAVEFLRDAAAEVGNLRTLENRIGFASEMAALMWLHDEKDARRMFVGAITDFRQMFGEIEAQITAAALTPEQIAMGGFPFSPNADPRAKLAKRFAKAVKVRQQIAVALSEHDPLAAHSFFLETGTAISGPAFKNQFQWQEKSLEMKLLNAIAEKDAGKGLDFARKSLAKGLRGEHLELLKSIYAKDAEKGAAFGEEVFGKIKSIGTGKDFSFYTLKSVFSAGAENRQAIKDKPEQKPLFSDENMRALAEMTAQEMLKDSNYDNYGDADSIIELIKTYQPARAAQIEQKRLLDKQKKEAIIKATRDARRGGGDDDGDGEAEMSAYMAAAKEHEKKEAEEKKMLADLKSLGEKKLSDEEREKIIGQARRTVAEIGDPNAKMMALGALAMQVRKMGDKETALEIMREAERFVSPQPKSYLDFMQKWMMSSSYAQIDAAKSFPVLEDTIFRLNETIGAFVKVGEFIDVSGEMIVDGEVQVSGFGGAGLAQELTRALGESEATLNALAKEDFARTKALTEKFDRTEVRILAKMLVLRAVFGSQKKSTETTPEVAPMVILTEN